MLLDILFLAIIVICVIHGAKRGIIKTALGLSSVFISIIAALLLYSPFINMISANPDIAAAIDGFKESIKTAVMPAINIDASGEMPAVFSYILDGGVIEQGKEAIAAAVAGAVVQLITIIVFVILIKLLVSLLLKVFKITAKLPVIKQANGLVGGLLGIVIGVFVCWITAALLTMFIGQEGFGWIAENIESSRIAKHLFKSNIIFSILR